MSYTKGYKAFTKGLVCRDFQFREGETYEVPGEPILCENGFHFCKDLVLTLQYYFNHDENLYAEVEALGDIVYEEPTKHKACTNKIKIVRVLSREEVNGIVDGHCNSGGYNSGNRNSGNRNSGNYNSGNYNSGNRNSGNRNSGHCNSGGYNSGDWNKCNRETGFFNTKQPSTVNVFNKPCPVDAWERAEKPSFIFFTIEDGETYKQAFQRSYSEASEEDKKLLLALPNFDADVFFEISGIRV